MDNLKHLINLEKNNMQNPNELSVQQCAEIFTFNLNQNMLVLSSTTRKERGLEMKGSLEFWNCVVEYIGVIMRPTDSYLDVCLKSGLSNKVENNFSNEYYTKVKDYS